MAIDFIDPGYGDKMLNSGGTALADNITIVENYTYNPFGGVAFTCTNSDLRFPFPLAGYSESESYSYRIIKFSVYCKDMSGTPFSAGFYASSTPAGSDIAFGGVSIHTDSCNLVFRNNTKSIPFNEGFHNIYISLGRRSQKLSAVGTTMTYRIYNSVFINVDGTTHSGVFSYQTGVSGAINLYCQGINFPPSSAGEFYVSNIISGSGAPGITNQLQVVRLPIKSTDTDMAAGENGEYIATGIGQTLLQTIDTAQLAENYGTNTAISHIVVGGYPCYAQNGAANITGISKENGEVTTHGSCGVSNDSLGAASTFWELSDKKISDLANIQVGWKAGA